MGRDGTDGTDGTDICGYRSPSSGDSGLKRIAILQRCLFEGRANRAQPTVVLLCSGSMKLVRLFPILFWKFYKLFLCKSQLEVWLNDLKVRNLNLAGNFCNLTPFFVNFSWFSLNSITHFTLLTMFRKVAKRLQCVILIFSGKRRFLYFTKSV